MKIQIRGLLITALLFTQTQAEIINRIENTYVKAANTLLFFTSENIISSGSYEFGDSDNTLKTNFFPVTYHFKSNSNFYNFYVNGSVGYSKYEEKNIDFRGSIDDIAIKTYALKIGAGIRFTFNNDTDMMIGSSYIYSKVNSDYNTPNPLSSTDPLERALDYVFNSNNTFDTVEWFTSVGYHPVVNEYSPYIIGDIRYFDTKVDDPLATISDTTSTIGKLKIGIITPPVSTVQGLPLKLEFYASDILIAGDMKEALGSNNFYMLGITFHLGTTTLNRWVSDISFDVNMVKGDNFDGFNFGFGLSF